MTWYWILPLASTGVGCVALAWSVRVLRRDAHAVVAAAAPVANIVDEVDEAARRARGYQSSVSRAAHRYTRRHG